MVSAEDHLSTLPHEFLIEHISDRRSLFLKLLRLHVHMPTRIRRWKMRTDSLRRSMVLEDSMKREAQLLHG